MEYQTLAKRTRADALDAQRTIAWQIFSTVRLHTASITAVERPLRIARGEIQKAAF